MLIIERLNGVKYDLEELGIITTAFYPEAPSPITQKSEQPGVDGHIDLGTTYAGRKLYADIEMFSQDYYEYSLLRNEIFRIFDSREHFYIIYKPEPKKRWKAKYDAPFSLQHMAPTASAFSLQFESPSAYSESIGSLLDPLTFDVELWQFGMNIPMIDFAYKHHTRQFSIWNLGDKHINPRHEMLQIFYKGASNGLKLTNITTGETWQYNGTSQASDTITLDGVFSRKNGVSIFGNTNRKLISLVPGENKFTLSGTSGAFEIAFDFRFLYL